MKPAKSKPLNDQAAMLLRRYNKLREASFGALKLLQSMQDEGAIRMPFQGYDEAVAALKKELG